MFSEHNTKREWTGKETHEKRKKKIDFCNNLDRKEDGSQQGSVNGNRDKTQVGNNF